MDFLKKHYEKIVLALVSVLLIVTALMLMGTFELKGNSGPGDDKTNISPADPLNTNELKAVTGLLKEPPPWTGTNERPFAIEVWKTDLVRLYKGDRSEITITNLLLELDWTITLRTFPMIFKGVASRVGTNDIFQLNIGGGKSSLFVKLGDSFRMNIYGVEEQFKVLRYEEKKQEVEVAATRGKRTVDVSVLTLERRSGREVKNIPLTVGREQRESEPVATYYSTITGERSGEFRRGLRLSFTYRGEQFEIVDITEREVVIKTLKDGKIDRRRASRVVRQ